MKKISFLIILFVLHDAIAPAQDLKNEIGIGVFRINSSVKYACFPEYQYQIPYINLSKNACDEMYEYASRTSPSLFFTSRIYKNLKWRSSFHYTKTIFDSYLWFGIDSLNFYTKAKLHSIQFSQGVQYDFLIKRKINPYLLVAGAVNHYISHGTQYNINHSLRRERATYTSTSLQVSIGAGIRFRFAKRFSTTIESLLATNHEEYYPLSRLSINYHF